MNAKDKIYYTRLISAVFAGVVNGVLWLYDIRGLIFAVFMLIASHYISIYFLGVDPEEFGGQWKVFTVGIFSYIFLGIVVWTLLFNFLTVPLIFPDGLPALD
ncbi:MAG: hypothetical protein ACTSYO_04285 [Candidatus Ranarchaeia archaeon]